MSRLYRSERDKKVFGLCGGLAEAFNIDVTILRLVIVVTAFFSGGTVVLLYIVASMVIPKESQLHVKEDFVSPPPYSPYHDTPENPSANVYSAEVKKPNIDDMMEDIEKKAMQKEIEELKRKISEIERGEK